jgi:hypothetical protein
VELVDSELERNSREPQSALTVKDEPIGRRADNRSIYIWTHHDRYDFFHISLFDLETDKRTQWKAIRPSISVDEVGTPRITPDSRAYAYGYAVVRSQLYLASGIR